MATNASEHLGLHLWEPTDQVLRTEFNQNWTKIDTAVNAAQETAEAAQSAAEQRPYVIGSYTGNGGTQSITLAFSILRHHHSPASKLQRHRVYRRQRRQRGCQHIVLHRDRLYRNVTPTSYETYPLTNQNGTFYHYLALR